jgi:hypothetical protein
MNGAADLTVERDSSMSFLFSIGYDESNDGYHLIEPWNVDSSMDLGQDDVRTSLNSLLIFSGLYRFLFVRKLVNGLGSILFYSRSISESLLLKLTNSHYWSSWECAHHNINRKSTMHSASFDIRSLNWITMLKHWLGSHKPIRVSRDATAEDCFGTVKCNPSSRELAWPGLQTAHYVLITIPWDMETFGVFCLCGMAITDHKHSKVLWVK